MSARLTDIHNTMSRRELTAEDLNRLTKARDAAGDPPPICAAMEVVTAAVIGHRLFTIMRHDPGRCEVERVHSSNTAAYPVGGRKTKRQTAWADQVLGAMKVFRATTPEEIRATFDDHETILGLGIGSILNIPIVFEDRCLGTMNLCHEAGWYRPRDAQTGLILGPYLLSALHAI
jgi:GAF domain-containing protein